MRNENKKSKKTTTRRENISNRPVTENDRNLPSGTGLIGEHDMGDAAERKIGRTTHDKNSVTGSDLDGQAE